MSEERTEKIPQHRHCVTCGRAFVGEGKYCSEACESEKTADIKKKKNRLIIIWVLAVLMMVYAIFYLA